MFAERIKKSFVSLVGGDENCGIGSKLVLRVLIDFFRRDSSCLELEITTSDMKTKPNKCYSEPAGLTRRMVNKLVVLTSRKLHQDSRVDHVCERVHEWQQLLVHCEYT